MNPIARLILGFVSRSITMRRSQFKELPLPPQRVLFLGDSITEGGQWDEWFPQLQTLNRGIGGDDVQGVLTRLDTAIHDPVAISLLIGTNDLGGAKRKAEDIAASIQELVKEIRKRAPKAPFLINSVMPRRRKYRENITFLNSLLRNIAARENAVFVDLWPALADDNGALREEFTADALHLNGLGYAAWAKVLRSEFSTLGLVPATNPQLESAGPAKQEKSSPAI
ncbi:GDSL-type esterase/lipase family protein [Arthrobacter bambusae]|uniref:GDSL-type esterase/lipase family protein n=1 Tax=Arthrobacter bambusae TaxID=1338426 RepID=UPI002788D15C|nr:GDSL-type esterase/lipase family protein [Arthrobacter bambusae]MDQ0031503.1 lysophospholipase L1-like esterase [Arthrobacter bambusae]MDQ0099726.1 lysophospholipase L1-like esterase [Arthrobacter bambusae]